MSPGSKFRIPGLPVVPLCRLHVGVSLRKKGALAITKGPLGKLEAEDGRNCRLWGVLSSGSGGLREGIIHSLSMKFRVQGFGVLGFRGLGV